MEFPKVAAEHSVSEFAELLVHLDRLAALQVLQVLQAADPHRGIRSLLKLRLKFCSLNCACSATIG